MPVPIVIFAGLRPYQSFLAMRRLGYVPFCFEVRPKADYEDSFTFLGNPVIGGIEDLRGDAIMQVCVSPVLISVLIMARKSGDMILPVLAISSREFRIRQTELDILEIAREGWSCKSLHVLENKCARAELPHGANGFPPHVTLIKVSPKSRTAGTVVRRKRGQRFPEQYHSRRF